MIYIDAPLKEFCEKHQIWPKDEDAICPSCKKEFPPPRPVYIKGYAGIQYKCPCEGPYSSPATFVPRTEEKKEFWKGVLG